MKNWPLDPLLLNTNKWKGWFVEMLIATDKAYFFSLWAREKYLCMFILNCVGKQVILLISVSISILIKTVQGHGSGLAAACPRPLVRHPPSLRLQEVHAVLPRQKSQVEPMLSMSCTNLYSLGTSFIRPYACTLMLTCLLGAFLFNIS